MRTMFHRDKTVVSSISLFSIMKSRLTLDFVDFEGNGSEPVIRIDLNPSDDVRDKFLKSLFQNSNGHMTIRWGNQEFEPNEEGYLDKRSKIYLRNNEDTLFSLHQLIMIISEELGTDYPEIEKDITNQEIVKLLRKMFTN